MSNCIDLKGEKYGRLAVVSRVPKNNKSGNAMWNCICDCGNKLVIQSNNLKNGHTKSCGCLNKELTAERSITHGLSNHPIYSTWKNIHDRCKNNKYYINIKVCKRWNSIENFIEDMLPTWEEGLTIDREDNNGDYEPGNCRWATVKEQLRNTRRNISVIGRDKNTKKIVCIYKIKEDAQYNGYNPSHISQCLLAHRKTHKGLIWSKY